MRAPRSIGLPAALSAASWVAASRVAAHPGHGLDDSATGVLHFLFDLAHGGSGIVALLALTVGATAMTIARRRD